eukprot:m.91178 g.91178  ORF g.91178 m.91178 type:complete len:752 (+) comp14900_c0_seq2:85-2340(+)
MSDELTFPQLQGQCYLDTAGACIPSKELLDACHADLTSNLYGNPHSAGSKSSQASSDRIESLRNTVLGHFNVTNQTHAVVFTSSATHALQLIADAYGNTKAADSKTPPTLYQLSTNHTSVVGLRRSLQSKGWAYRSIKASEVESLHKAAEEVVLGPPGDSLFTMPALCSYSGTKQPLEWIQLAREGRLLTNAGGEGVRCKVLLDAASYVCNHSLDLSSVPADYTVLSFYKMFGYPTGVGALIVRLESAEALQPVYFGGGSIDAYSGDVDVVVSSSNVSKRLEHGTLPFTALCGVETAFKLYNSIGMQFLHQRSYTIARAAYTELYKLHHANGCKVVLFHMPCQGQSPELPATQGPILTFVLLRPDGSQVSPNEVQTLASLNEIHLRAGCLCNSGACHEYAKLDPTAFQALVAQGYRCGTSEDIDERGYAIGGVRVSFGIHNTLEDVARLVEFLHKHFVDPTPMMTAGTPTASPCTKVTITQLSVYPIKSCGAFHPSEWPIGPTGFQHDRSFMLINSAGRALTQKQQPLLATIKPIILDTMLCVRAAGCARLQVPLQASVDDPAAVIQSRVCADNVAAQDCGPEAAQWFEAVLGQPCRLVRLMKGSARDCRQPGATAQLSFANEAQYLAISQSSLNFVTQAAGEPIAGDVFRSNMLVSGSGLPAFDEDRWTQLKLPATQGLPSSVLSVVGRCARCRMICIDQTTGKAQAEPLETLSRIRRDKGRTYFGVLLSLSSAPKEGEMLRVGLELNLG